ncbi:MAG TPA: hypothetical protein VNA88_11150 [Candidatus Kapabacteria bacterium]|nr:hypothetical protein [Candidatus Kapabacteria bacterium]
MVSFTRDDLTSLAAVTSPACISIYLPPRHAGSGLRIDMTRARNLVRIARGVLHERIGDEKLVDDVMRPLESLAGQRELWRDPEHGVVIFRAPELLRMYRLPVDIPEMVRVDTCFDLLPLVELAVDDGTFFILAIDRREVRLFRATRQSMIEQSLGTIPAAFDEYLATLKFERASQMHTAASTALSAGAGGSHRKAGGVFHGSPGRRERAKREFEGFLHAIDRRLMGIIGSSGAPLVLAGVAEARAMYRSVSTYPSVVAGGVGVTTTTALLHRRAWDLVAPTLLRGNADAVDRLRRNAGTPTTLFDTLEIADRSSTGQIGTLFIATDDHHRAIGAHYGGLGVEPLGRAVNNVVRNSGTLCTVHERLPNDAPAAALLRY